MALQGKHILVGISGGIAAYKIPELIRGLVKAGAEVRVATTRHALEFVTELTLQTVSGHPVYSDVFAAINAHATEHISLPEWCDAMIVAPATANVVAKMAAGIADDALTTTICSCVARKPILIAPAMNDKMWENPATQHAVETIRSWQNVRVIEPAEGPLACGVVGKGRMPEAEELQEALEYVLTPPTLAGQRILITAGGTQEPIDPVRFISNYSTGKMGVALAQVCARRGAEVTMVCGSMSVTPRNPFGAIHRIDALSAQEMYETCIAQWPRMNSAILCAAVADFTPCEKAENKIKKGDRSLVNGDRSLVIGGKPSSAERSRTSSVSREDAPGDLVGLLVGVIGGHFFVHLPERGFGEIPGDGRDSGNPQHGLIPRHPIEGKDTNGHGIADQEDACCSQFEIFLIGQRFEPLDEVKTQRNSDQGIEDNDILHDLTQLRHRVKGFVQAFMGSKRHRSAHDAGDGHLTIIDPIESTNNLFLFHIML